MSYYTFIHAFVNAPFTASTPIALTDASALTQVVLADGMYVDAVYFDQSNLSSNGTISIGWSGNTDGVVPSSAAITAVELNAGKLAFNPSNKCLSPIGNQNLVVTSDSNITSGTINLIIKAIDYASIP